MVLGGNHHRIIIDIFHRMVTAVVTELHLDGFRTARQRQQLMAEADAKYRNIGFKEGFDCVDSVIARRRVTRTV
ncbi:hypothetical protein D3C72_2136780 [compost metagenome]